MKLHIKSDLKCPLCNQQLTITPGSCIDPTDGTTLWCNTPHGNGAGQCPAQEVMGHGRNEDAAFKIIEDKFNRSKV